MKPLFVGIGAMLLFVSSILFTHDYNQFIRQYEHLKYVVDEAAATANLFLVDQESLEGERVFNQTEGDKAIRYLLKEGLALDSNLRPTDKSYWKENITYQTYYLDSSTITYPYLFEDDQTGYTKLITEPTVIVTVDAGNPQIIFIKEVNFKAIRTSGYQGLEN